MENVTFEMMPEAIRILMSDVSEIKAHLFNAAQKESDSDKWMTLSQLCNYLPDKPSQATVYVWTSKRTIPSHKSGKKLRFLKSEIDFWLRQGRRKSLVELQAEAESDLIRSKKKA